MWKFGGWIIFTLVLVGCDPATKPTPDVARPTSPDIVQPTAADPSVQTGTISVLAWNVESGGNDPEIIAQLGQKGASQTINTL
jgi:hypothetical protein